MTDVRTQLEAMFEKLATVIPEPGDYADPATGLLLCGKCHTPKQCSVDVLGKMRVLPCICRCEHERHEAEEAARKERDRLDRVHRLKANGLQDKVLLAYTFDLDDGTNSAMRYARNYVAHWRELKERGHGLLLWGGVGTGKTFAAACIANALTEQGVPVLMTNFVKILNSLSGMFSEDRNKYLSSFNQFPLLIIDDLGIERSSEFAQEQVYSIVDSRYLSRLPFIITTNLALSELQDPPDLARARIYDRILERCVPICFSGKNYRAENAVRNREDAQAVLQSDFSEGND